MYTITLEVNLICNLQCAYCYLGEKTNKTMTKYIAYKGLELAFINAEKHKDKTLWVDFVGGEALISFRFLRELVIYIDEQANKRNIFVMYSITSNGTLMNDEILNWLIENKIRFKLSIDGNKEVHDKNRKLLNGSGSYDSIIQNLKYFRNYEKMLKNIIQVSHVITHNNYYHVFESVKHLVEDLHFRMIDSSIDFTNRWSKSQLDYLAQEWDKLFNYYIERKEKRIPFLWGPMIDMLKYGKMEQKHYFCGVGLVQIYVNVSGEIYGCAANLKNGFLGNVEKGLLVEKIEKYRELARKDNLCIECSLCKVCQSKNCIMNSLVYSGLNCTLCQGHFEFV